MDLLQLNPDGGQRPLLIAGGGGGLGPTQFHDDGVQHAKGSPPYGHEPINGTSFMRSSGKSF